MPAAEAERDLGLAGARSRGEAERLAVLAGERPIWASPPGSRFRLPQRAAGSRGIPRHPGVVKVDPDHVHHVIAGIVAV